MLGVVGSSLKMVKFEPTTPNTSQHGGQTHATCCAQQCCDMLCWHVAIVWPGLKTIWVCAVSATFSVYSMMTKEGILLRCDWVIPENIHTIPRAASWNSEGEGGFLDWNSEDMGVNAVWNSKGMGGGGVSALNLVNFQRKDSESSAWNR